MFSSPYHYQANSPAERTIKTCKSLLTKAIERERSFHTRPQGCITQPHYTISSLHLTSYYSGRNLKLLPSATSNPIPRHLQEDSHQEANPQCQTKQAEFYIQRSGRDKGILNNKEPLLVSNTLKGTWKPATFMNKTQSIPEPRTDLVDIGGTISKRMREHLKPTTQGGTQSVSNGEPC